MVLESTPLSPQSYAARRYNDETTSRISVIDTSHRVCHKTVHICSVEFGRKAQDNESVVSTERKHKRICKSQITAHEHCLLFLSKPKDMLVGPAPETMIANVEYVMTVGMKCRAQGSRKIFVEDDFHTLGNSEFLLGNERRRVRQRSEHLLAR